jgi:hypothetical protein
MHEQEMERKMQKIFSLLAGLCLILMGVVFLAGNLLFPVIGLDVNWLQAWRLWPLIILGLGVFLTVLALTAVRKPGMGAIFIPASVVLTVGAICLYASLTGYYRVWVTAWPLVVLALALGFILAALASRIVWLLIPAIMVGLNGLVLAYCNTTGLWSAWSVLWAVEPLGVGLVFLLISIKLRSWLMAGLGFLFGELAWMAVFSAVAVPFLGAWAARLIGPALLILAGGLLLVWAVFSRPRAHLNAQ